MHDVIIIVDHVIRLFCMDKSIEGVGVQKSSEIRLLFQENICDKNAYNEFILDFCNFLIA